MAKELTGKRFDSCKPSVVQFLYKVFTETEIGREFIQDLKSFCENEQPKQTTTDFYQRFIDNGPEVAQDYLKDMDMGLLAVTCQSMFGAEAKGYGKGNWKGGMEWSRIVDPILRHIIKDFFLGRDFDTESGGPEATGAAWGCLAYLTYKAEDLGLDNRKDFRV